MDLNLYRVFVQVYESETLSIASERLHISQSAVSHALKRLRLHFDDELFVKEGRKLVVTAFARRIYPQVKKSVSVLIQCTEPTKIDTLIEQTNQVTIAMNDDLELVLLPTLHEHFLTVAPHIRINSVRLERNKMTNYLQLGKIDVAIDVSRIVAENLYQQPLLSDTFVVLTNHTDNNSADKSKAQITIDDYLKAQHITVSSRPIGQSIEDVGLAKLGYHHRNIAVRCQHYESAVRLLQKQAKNIFLLTIPKLIADSLHTDGLTQFMLPMNMSELELHMYWHEEMQDDTLSRWVRQQISDVISSTYNVRI